jgi:hypothetical protein
MLTVELPDHPGEFVQTCDRCHRPRERIAVVKRFPWAPKAFER